MNFRIYMAIGCFLCTGILKHRNGIATAGSTFSKSRQLSCLFETSETILLSNEVKYIRQNAWLLVSGTESKDTEGPHPENPPAGDTITFIIQEPSLDILQHVDEDVDKLECKISRYFTDNTQILWPGIQTRSDRIDSWFTGTIKHLADTFTVTVFLVQSGASTEAENRIPGDVSQGNAERFYLSGVFLVRTGPSLIQSGLNKDVLLSCAFSVDHHTDVTIKWVLQQKGAQKKVVFAYNGSTRQVEHKNKRAEMFLAEIPKGNASLLLRTVEIRDEGIYSCSVFVSSLLGTQDIQLEIVEKPTVTLNADMLSLVEGDEHKVICDISHFYPHDAEAQWLQEPKEQGLLPHVVNHVVFSSHRQNNDGTYSFSSYFLLKASLRDDGCRYTCRVEHQSLKYPIRKSLTVKVTESTSSTWLLVILFVLAACLVVALYCLHKGHAVPHLRTESAHREWKERPCASVFSLLCICTVSPRLCFSKHWA
ncbi:tapasin-related protein-like isoform X2 [Emydura macquarii macquarii]|uniref:tapasin-related protein-like isoform X2 n=1 Tax=Emydura macquarii macquarii TaxID=1129001 RepID=UPI00352B317D